MEGIADQQVPMKLAQNIVQDIATPFLVKGASLSISVSIGISVFPRDGDILEQLVAKADSAMYEVKRMGGDGVRFYRAENIVPVSS